MPAECLPRERPHPAFGHLLPEGEGFRFKRSATAPKAMVSNNLDELRRSERLFRRSAAYYILSPLRG
jgi:hypothetical protein